ncbi:MAG: HlyD family efflux transporter periplasmic adaptor subunit, partial [Acutalibacteraceae bacterium]
CSINDLSAKIEKIIDEEEKAAVILSCDTMTDNLVILRSEAIEIHANSYSGLRVSTRAIRVVEGIQGVYVLNKNEADFKPVNIIFSTVDYVICSTTDDNNSFILYDEIITEGSNLYDGKVVK